MKKIILLILAIVMVAAMLISCASAPFDETSPIAAATLAGPTGMGMVQMLENEAYDIGVYSAPDQITPKIITGEVSMATVPSNLAAVLYNKMDGAIKVVAVNTMGVLYILENGNTVADLSDLSGKTIYATGQGATPEYVLNEVLAANGLDDVTVVYMGAHADLANAMAAGEVTLALVPEPFVSIVLANNPDVQVKVDVNAEWKSIYGTDIPMGVTVVSTELADNKAAMDKIIADYSASVNFVAANLGEASQAIEDTGIIAAAAIARSAIPRCAISFITGEDAKAMLTDYFGIMFDVAPASIGGELPGDDFYYMP
ncbi:MAG: ABC transporter substrate-binding protein [Clostridia bacterium]|jgi:NitT/TauT family transport system substrate-binding protein|nr:ABC transporter substrate-binding protein [Clostridia bacterium]MBT7121657.1 ABC transporter substrate-binding protein [Clostridia bacterium]